MNVNYQMVFEAIKKSTDDRITLDNYVKHVRINAKTLEIRLYNSFKVEIDEYLIKQLMETCDDIKISEFAKMIADQINSGNQSTTNNNYTSGTSYQTQTRNYSSTSNYNNSANKYTYTNNTASSKSISIPVNIQLANDLKNLSNEIRYGQNELEAIIESLDDSSLEVNIKRNWWGTTNKESIVDSIENVYSNLSYYIGLCGKALQHTNDNLVRTLELIKLLALVEKELYQQVENQSVTANELKTVIYDWLKKQGIRDEEIQKILETSINRAYTLRNRINSLRQENAESIARLEERINTIEKKQTTNTVKTPFYNNNENTNKSFTPIIIWTLLGSAITSGIVAYLIATLSL